MRRMVLFSIVAITLLLSACGSTNNSSQQVTSVIPYQDQADQRPIDADPNSPDRPVDTVDGLNVTLNHERQLSRRNTHTYGVMFNGQSQHTAMSSISTHNVIVLDELNNFDRSIDNGNRLYYPGFRSNLLELDNNTIATTIKTENQLRIIKLNLETQNIIYSKDFDDRVNDNTQK